MAIDTAQKAILAIKKLSIKFLDFTQSLVVKSDAILGTKY
ncbi:predicted protein [Sclerotinia sclerotiorum 1980 UF-70]|uniref:Uncharacterized protein n=1 Tax=Sclerotinia sclerotiorum (strain ATCC 18683 / 1980 / Ss-1) TaxID=665079 RepID=A7EVB6_SCLS1|nr:predicted protein [Sclerotinia sclerotiorum 1980 UF-70]EDN93408.1 predicted protein [Sclerotinia sclerotiorum 1980 UF-70]